MRLYEYRCLRCEHRQESRHRDTAIQCEKCNTPMVRVYSANVAYHPSKGEQ